MHIKPFQCVWHGDRRDLLEAAVCQVQALQLGKPFEELCGQFAQGGVRGQVDPLDMGEAVRQRQRGEVIVGQAQVGQVDHVDELAFFL